MTLRSSQPPGAEHLLDGRAVVEGKVYGLVALKLW